MQRDWDGLGNCSDGLGNIDNAWQGMVHQCTLHQWMWERYTMCMIRKAKHKNRKRHLPKLGQESNVYSASRLWTLRTWRVFSLLTLHFMRECTFPWPSLSISTALMLIFCLYSYICLLSRSSIWVSVGCFASDHAPPPSHQVVIHIQLQDCLLNQFFRSDPLENHYKVIEHVLDTTFRFPLHAPGACWRARLASVASHLTKDVILSTVAHSLSSSAVFHTYQMLRAICGSTSLQWFGSA